MPHAQTAEADWHPMARDIPLVTNINTTCNWSGRYVSAPTTERAFTYITNMQTYAVKAHCQK
jgi:hypothetical protein